MKWIIAFAVILSAGVMGYLYVDLEMGKGEGEHMVVASSSPAIPVYHAYKDGEHRFIGQLKLPHSCYTLDAQTYRDPRSPEYITITLKTTDKMLDQSLCAQIPTNYPFQVLAEGPEKIVVDAELNGEPYSVRMTETSWQSSTGTYINPIAQ